MSEYHIRRATLADVDVLVRHRVRMFTEMGASIDEAAVASAFRRWLVEMIPAGTYVAWVAQTAEGAIAAGGGATVLPWPPGPHFVGGRVAFVYNVYTEPAHRRRGLARALMNAIHDWCRSAGIGLVGLTASESARPLYESMGYRAGSSPTLWAGVD